MYVDAQTIITAGSVIATLVALVTLGGKLFKWISHQKEQDIDIKRLENKFDTEIKNLKNCYRKDHL